MKLNSERKMNKAFFQIISFTFCLIFQFFLSSCNNDNSKNIGPQYGMLQTQKSIQTYHFTVHPLHNPAKLIECYKPLMDYLNEKIPGVQFKVETSRDYASFENKYKNKIPEFILPNPWQTIQAINFDYIVIAMAGDSNDFKGIFIVRKNSEIKTINDVKGKSFSYPSPTALAACIMPQYFLYENGINVNKDIENKFVGSQESAIMNVFLNKTQVGVTWPPPWRAFQKDFPKEADELKLIWETKPLINNSVMARNDISPELVKKVQKCLIDLDKTQKGKEILKNMETSNFTISDNKKYDVVKIFIQNFEKEVRSVDKK